ncbi:helix-turn-helix domain-containing protein [Algicola sagamiensis]|uniref:helix-turn-helix domain-containing protein n=1 Tax=Algicola sagamiensis TaxID=163869 RepID=UPI00037982A7|nr:helix-turn-helix transcriptional regulator [Algicola sagamiensis]
MKERADLEIEIKSHGRFLRQARKKSKLTQEKLAEKLDCSVRHIQNIEAGHTDPSFSLARRWLSVTKDWRTFFEVILMPTIDIEEENENHVQEADE